MSDITSVPAGSAFNAAVHVLQPLSHIAELPTSRDAMGDALEKFISRRGLLSGGEEVLLDAALELWNGGWGSKPTMGELVRWLDDDNLRRVLEGIAMLRPKAAPPVGVVAVPAGGDFDLVERELLAEALELADVALDLLDAVGHRIHDQRLTRGLLGALRTRLIAEAPEDRKAA